MLKSSLIALACAGYVVSAQAAQSAAPVELRAADGVVVHGLSYPAPHPKALILLFHQAGSSKTEYATIAPRLVAAGFSALAIDQRSGGPLFGPNETASGLARTASFDDAERDLDAALAWGVGKRVPVVLWGSSYSAALVFRVAAAHSREVAAVMAFSPGEYLADARSIHAAARRLTMPIYVTSASDPSEIAAAASIVSVSPARIKVQYRPQAGVHGSSTLIEARDPKGARAAWLSVSQFLSRVFP